MTLFASATADIANNIVFIICLVTLCVWLCFSVPEIFFTQLLNAILIEKKMCI